MPSRAVIVVIRRKCHPERTLSRESLTDTCALRATRRASSTPRASTRSAPRAPSSWRRRAEASPRDVALDPGVLAALIAEIRLPLKSVPGLAPREGRSPRFSGRSCAEGHQRLRPRRAQHRASSRTRSRSTSAASSRSSSSSTRSIARSPRSLLCSPGPTKPEAIQLQSQVESWLADPARLGDAEGSEGGRSPGLFLALTKFDMSLGALRSDNAKDRWDSRDPRGVHRLLGARARLVDLELGQQRAARSRTCSGSAIRTRIRCRPQAGRCRLRDREAGLPRVARGRDVHRGARGKVDRRRRHRRQAACRRAACRCSPRTCARRSREDIKAEELAQRRARSAPSSSACSRRSRLRATRPKSARASSKRPKQLVSAVEARDEPPLHAAPSSASSSISSSRPKQSRGRGEARSSMSSCR